MNANFRHVYFRLNQTIYVWGKGWVISEDARIEWHKQIAQLLELCKFNIKVPKQSMYCYEGFNCDGESLYMHPMDFSGYIHKDNIAKFEAIVRAFESKYWTVRGVDAYAMDTDDKHIETNKAKNAEIEIAKKENVLTEAQSCAN